MMAANTTIETIRRIANTMSRLESVSTTLTTSLREASTKHQQSACLAACEFAVERSGIDSPIIQHALQAMRNSQPVPPEIKRELKSLEQRLDDEYFHLQEAAEAGNASEDAWKRAFSHARATSALVFAAGEDAFEAASEAIYEASATVDDNRELIAVVTKVLDA